LASYAPDMLVFDLIKPLPYRGSDALRKRAAEWLYSFEGPVGYEVHVLRITEAIT
jgi:ketosteroid isomerase-like protein